jgi:hypothetical protein
MDQAQVQIIHAQIRQSLIDAFGCFDVGVTRIPDFAGDEEIFAFDHPALHSLINRGTDFLLVLVNLGAIKMSVSDSDRIRDRLTDLILGRLPRSESQLWYGETRIHSDFWDGGTDLRSPVRSVLMTVLHFFEVLSVAKVKIEKIVELEDWNEKI